MAGNAATWFSDFNWVVISNWLGSLDWTKIISVLVVPVLGTILMWWKGGFHWIINRYAFGSTLHRYRRNVRKEVSSLTVIGRRQGFDLEKVYVNISISRSDLMSRMTDERISPPKSFILVGGPGAGKSTYVKKITLDSLNLKSIPFFIRLRECDSALSVEDLLVRRLETLGIRNAGQVVLSELNNPRSLCILDGLDEVRPQLLGDVLKNVNSFYKKYFQGGNTGGLIVTCRKEAYRSIPLEIPEIWEVVPLKDNQIRELARTWPLRYPSGKSAEGFGLILPQVLKY
jgi:hypothetical protein